MELLDWLRPDGLAQGEFLFLIAISALTSAMTAMMGVGGGAVLIAVMANIMPPVAVIPVHGTVQLGSNLGRVLTMQQHIRWPLVGWFALGCLLGSVLGGQIAVSIPTHWLKLIIGSFILYSCWLPLRTRLGGGRSGILLGAVTAFVGMFVGVTATFVIATLRNTLPERMELVGTMAALMAVQHALKALVFGLFGFAFFDWLGLVLLMIITGFAGTLLGKKALERTPSEYFSRGLKLVLTLLALKLLWDGASLWF
ncbi:sulfite exporter TauE/SafE family protein [Marinobacterium rhizophilum]|nr:sulfite exporter TauE/SafE family protein [Marinobacterium rhizophilum]